MSSRTRPDQEELPEKPSGRRSGGAGPDGHAPAGDRQAVAWPVTEWSRLVQAAPTIFFWYTRLSGILSLLAWVSYGLILELSDIWALRWIGYLGWFPSVPIGLVWILLSMGVRRRKKAAWRILLLVLCLPATLHLTAFLAKLFDPGLDVPPGVAVAAVLHLAAIGLLVAARGEFTTLPDRANRRLAALVFATLLVVTCGIGTCLVTVTDRDDSGGFWTHPVYAVTRGPSTVCDTA